MGIFLGVATALAWGSADFLARFVSRTLGSIRAVFWMHAWGAIFLTVYLGITRDWGHLFDGSGWLPWAWGALAGVLNTFGMLALYRAFEIGKMSVVAPISASYPALTVILSMLSGERLSLVRAAGILAASIGVVLVATGEKAAGAQSESKRTTGLVWAIGAAIAFGFLYWLLGTRIIADTGALAAVWMIRVTGSLLTFAVLLLQKVRVKIGSGRTAVQSAGMGLLDTGAFALSNVGMQLEQVAVITVLGSLYGAVTVALAAMFLRERIAPLQWAGVASIFLGVFLMNR
jgi:drug/metabolite transporter (DMT)-like permease